MKLKSLKRSFSLFHLKKNKVESLQLWNNLLPSVMKVEIANLITVKNYATREGVKPSSIQDLVSSIKKTLTKEKAPGTTGAFLIEFSLVDHFMPALM